MARIDFALSPGRMNAHYEGSYGAAEMEWRRICAVEKASNLKALLGGRRASVGSVLEVGCGTGAVLHEVKRAEIGRTHEGVDLADPNLHADAHAVAAGITLREYDGKRLPFPDRSVDLVYASHVLEHVPDERSFLAELRRVAAKFVYVEVPCELHARAGAAQIQKTLDIGHINAYTPESFGLTLVTSGLQNIDLQVFDHRDEVYLFQTSPLRAKLRMAVRRSLLKTSPFLASRLFTYHCGALCAVETP